MKEEDHEINNISIHTPTKGVTLGICPQDRFFVISIHTPTKGVTWTFKKENA